MILKYKDSFVVFVHPPRSSGTSIEYCMLNSGTVPDNSKHLNATQIKNHLGEEAWSKSFKFGIVRNPWDRMASLYITKETPFVTYNHHAGNSMVEFLKQYTPMPWEHGIQCSDYLNEPLDYIIRFEKRLEGIDFVNSKLKDYGLNIDSSVVKRAHPKKKPYSEYYDNEADYLMREMFKDDIARWYS